MPTLSAVLQEIMQQEHVGSQTLSKLTGIPRTSIDNWREGLVQRPKHWHPLLQIAQILALSVAEADALLIAAGYPSVARLATSIPLDHPDQRYLQPWLESVPLALQRDLEQRLHTVEARIGEAAVPPARPLHQLRTPIADFVGRADTIATLLHGLRRAQQGAVATISGVRGMGGIGKTELAVLAAHHVSNTFPDAQIVVNLRGASASPLPVAQALRQVIHAFTPDAQLPEDLDTLVQRYCAVLHGQRALILADDARDASHVRPLLPPPGCALLVTSRQRFSLPGMLTVDLEQLTETEAVALLRSICDRLSMAEACAIAQACGALPLALRISGSILHNDPALKVVTYLARLSNEQQRLSLLSDPDEPQLDVAAALALSYAQLDQAAQLVFRQLGVLVADFSTPMALAVVEAPEGVDVETTLRLLLRRNLIMYDARQGRWRLHDLFRDLARRELEAAGELESTMRRYARAAVQIAQETQQEYLAGGGSVLAALARFDVERAHIDAGRHWVTTQAGTPEGDQLLLDIAQATSVISGMRYAQQERIPLWERTHTAARRLGDQRTEGVALSNLGVAYAELGDIRRAIPVFGQVLAIARAIGFLKMEASALGNLGTAYATLGEARQAIPYFEQCLTIAQATDDRRNEGQALSSLGDAYAELGEAQQAVELCEQALAVAQQIGDRRQEGLCLRNLGHAYADLGEARRAIEACEEALTIARAIEDQWSEAYALSCLACAQALHGDFVPTTTIFDQALALFRAVGDRWGEANCNWHFGLFLTEHGERERALLLLRAAVAYEQEIGHAKADEHVALLARLEAGGALSAALGGLTEQCAGTADTGVPSRTTAHEPR